MAAPEFLIEVFSELGKRLSIWADNCSLHPRPTDRDEKWEQFIQSVYGQNRWFTRENVARALNAWSVLLTPDNLREWLKPYEGSFSGNQVLRKIGVVNAGNIPLAGFHDFLSVLTSGHRYSGKNASDDSLLLPYISRELCRMHPALEERIQFVNTLKDSDAIIATGSNNSSRYFEYYFSKFPHIIRKNRNGIAVLSGEESDVQLAALGDDVFSYFGLGCRNVSSLYCYGKDITDRLFRAFLSQQEVMHHNKYMNNYDYHNALFLMKNIPFLQNGFLILKDDDSIASPVSVLHRRIFDSKEELMKELESRREAIQCIATEDSELQQHPMLGRMTVAFGSAQSPALYDYADGVDTMKFLLDL